MRRASVIVILLAVAVAAVAAAALFGSGAFMSMPGNMLITAEFDPQPPAAPDAGGEPALPVAEDLAIPWDIAFLPGGEGMLVTERGGRVVHIESGRTFPVEGVAHVGEGGLLGIALHPDFAANRLLYLYQTTRPDGVFENRVVRYRYQNDALSFDRVIIEGLPASANHDGGRIAFGPDGLLYITVGDASDAAAAQDFDSLAGKILRLRDDGAIPPGNFGTAVYSFGHRNPQGLAWDRDGRLWATEHGQARQDEVNLIRLGANYGWPVSQGDEVAEGTVGPALHSGTDVTWAPGGMAYLDGSLYFGGLRGEALYEAVLDGERIAGLRQHFRGEFGRIRTVVLGPDGMLYLATSNRDGRGAARSGDDKIIRVDPAALR